TPGTSVIHDHGIGKPVKTKGVAKGLLDRLSFLIGQGSQAQIKARVIVKDRERVGSSGHSCNRTFEIHLPKTIGHFMLKALPVRFGCWIVGIDQTATMKNRRNGTTGRHLRWVLIFHQTTNLARSPARMALTQRHNGFFSFVLQLPRASLGTAREICQSGRSLLMIPSEPFVAGLSADTVAPAKRRKTHLCTLTKSDKLFAKT